jgi:hypothetical protein
MVLSYIYLYLLHVMDKFTNNRVSDCELDSSGSPQGLVEGLCDHCNQITGSIKGYRVLDQLRDYQLLNNDIADISNSTGT